MKKHKVTFAAKRKGGLPKNLKEVSFTTYEKARSAIRCYIRTMKTYHAQEHGYNPAMGQFGFSVVKNS
jgi:hypothetical protein